MDANSSDSTVDRELARAGALGAAHAALWRAVRAQSRIPDAVLQQCFDRMAAMHGLATAGSSVRTSATLPDVAAAVEFTEIYAQDPAAITDALADAVKRHFGEAGLVALVEALGLCDARLRLGRLLPLLATGAAP